MLRRDANGEVDQEVVMMAGSLAPSKLNPRLKESDSRFSGAGHGRLRSAGI